jgi:serine/threonine protein kinase
MTFEPEPGMRIHLENDEVIEFVPLEASGPASVFVYAESGKEGTVYKVLKDKELYALKVFYPQYRDKRLLENTDKLGRFKDLEGFRVAKRRVMTPEVFPDLLNKFPDLTYAVLMPWIDGTVWGNLMLETDSSLQAENYVQIAHALTRVVSSLELQGLAHCDLSNNNFIIAKSPAGIQLIDIEDMYAPDMPRPIPDVSYGSVGYRTKWIAEKGLWGPESDRFSLAVLCSEIITWHHEEIRENKSGSTSFFDEEEIGDESDRYKLMLRYLGSQSDELPALLERAWFAADFEQCPSVMEWRAAIRRVQLQVAPEPSPYVEDQTHIATIIMRKDQTPDLTPVEVVPEPEPQLVEEVEDEQLPSAVVDVEMIEEETTANWQEQASPESAAEHPPEVDDQMELEELVPEQSDGTMPIGVPPKMNLNLEILDFGTIGGPENFRQFSISNSGGAILDVSIQAEEWIDLSHRELAIAPGEQQLITASINTRFPMPKTGSEYRTASALTIETNVGSEVIGAKFNLAKPAFYESWWKRALLGMLVGSIFGCMLLLLALAGADPTTIVVIPIVLMLCGLAGIIAYPRKSSVVPLVLGFVLVEILSLILGLLLNLQDEITVILGVGAGLGCIGGAIASRIFIPIIRRADGSASNN